MRLTMFRPPSNAVGPDLAVDGATLRSAGRPAHDDSSDRGRRYVSAAGLAVVRAHRPGGARAVPALAAGRRRRPDGDVAGGEPDPARVLPRRRRDDGERRRHAEHRVPGRASVERRLRVLRDADGGRRRRVRLFRGTPDLHPRGAAEPAQREQREPVLGVPGDRSCAAGRRSRVRVAHEQRRDVRQHRRSPVPRHALRRRGGDAAGEDPGDRRERQPDRRREMADDIDRRPPERGRRAEHVLRRDPLRSRRRGAARPCRARARASCG
jgi:hypothetical protein